MSARPMSTRRVCLQLRFPFASTRRVHPGQLQLVLLSVYCSVSYSVLELLLAKHHVFWICLLIWNSAGAPALFIGCWFAMDLG